MANIIAGITVFSRFIIVIVTLSVVLTRSDSSKNIEKQPIIVNTDCGNVEGKTFDVTTDENEETKVTTFKNIPYAVPPVNELRWRAPIALNKDKSKCWAGTLKYSNQKVICKQPPWFFIKSYDWKDTKEDCLVLSVRTPQVKTTANLPVLVWIHGGGMVWGHGEQLGYHPDEELTASLNVVCVTINYRLGLFGFLSLKELWETSSTNPSYANFGIMDQILALKWVRNNIKNFGGNPKDITVFGHSGGGTAVYSLISSSVSRGLFRKAIATSGAPYIKTTYKQSNKIYRPFITAMGCNQITAVEIKSCLKKISSEKIALFDISNIATYPLIFPENKTRFGYPLEVLDPIVIQQTPGMLPADVGGKLDIMITTTAQELSHMEYFKDYKLLKEFLEPRVNSFTAGLYPIFLNLYRYSTKMFLPSNCHADCIYQTMNTDVLITCGNSEVSQNLATIPNYNVFRFIVAQPPEIKGRPLSMNNSYSYHGWDIFALFGLKNVGPTTPNEEKFQRHIRGVYKSFITDDVAFYSKYNKKEGVFFNNTIISLDTSYHGKECEVLKQNGLLRYAWGNR